MKTLFNIILILTYLILKTNNYIFDWILLILLGLNLFYLIWEITYYSRS